MEPYVLLLREAWLLQDATVWPPRPNRVAQHTDKDEIPEQNVDTYRTYDNKGREDHGPNGRSDNHSVQQDDRQAPRRMKVTWAHT